MKDDNSISTIVDIIDKSQANIYIIKTILEDFAQQRRLLCAHLKECPECRNENFYFCAKGQDEIELYFSTDNIVAEIDRVLKSAGINPRGTENDQRRTSRI